MLRITVHNSSEPVTLQLEGRLTAPWLEELAECWRQTLPRDGTRTIRVDLTGLTFVDNAGKAYLKVMHRRGAEFVTADCETKSTVDEITRNPVSNNGHSKQNGRVESSNDDLQN